MKVKRVNPKNSCHKEKFFSFNFTMSFPGGSVGKESTCNAGGLGSIPGLGRSPGEGNGNPLQYSCLENPTDGGTWWATVHGVAKSWTQLSDFTFNRASQVAVVVKNLPANAGDLRDVVSIPGSGRSTGGGRDSPLQYSCLENPTDRGTWWATVHRIAKS